MSRFMLILRDEVGWDSGASPEQIQKIIQKYTEWSGGLEQKGKLAGGEKLVDRTGRVVRRSGDGLDATDGPFAEAKEVVGGYFVIQAESYDEAVEISRDCPHLAFGSIEVREIDELG